jgi:pimeloyl-ACP methyl ester carboxylesterase
MDAIVHRISAWDGFPLVVREWRDGDARPPLLCLPGIVRTSGDFEALAQALGTGRRVIAPDYPGRGLSGRSRDIARYAPEACLRDVLDICAALHLHKAIAIGTSFGGLLCMGVAAARPSLFRAVVLNDIGPEIGSDGAEFVRQFIGRDIAFPISTRRSSICAPGCRHCRWSDEAWRAMASSPRTRWRWQVAPVWDTRIARLMNGKPRSVALFAGLTHLPAGPARSERHTAARDRDADAGGTARHGAGNAARHRPRADTDRAGNTHCIAVVRG